MSKISGISEYQIHVISAVCIAHMLSHFSILAIPVLIPIIATQTSVTYLELGIGIALFNYMTVLLQTKVGALVDKYNPVTFLLIAIFLSSISFMVLIYQFDIYSFYTSMIISGIANSAYHPCNYALLSYRSKGRKQGMVFSIHTCAGFLGGALAPVILVIIVENFHLRAAFIVATIIGLFTLLSVFMNLRNYVPQKVVADVLKTDQSTRAKGAFNPIIIQFFAFFFLLGISISAIEKFFVSSMVSGYGYELNIANAALTCFLFATVAGVIIGGFLADRTTSHDKVTSLMFLGAAIPLAIIIITRPNNEILIALMILAGIFIGAVSPSRDMLVLKFSRQDNYGKTFGIVSTGFNVGNILGSIALGWLMGKHHFSYVMWAMVISTLLPVLLLLKKWK